MTDLAPFWRYYGGKWRIARRYPEPRHDTIIEPFAGAAGYSLRYPERNVILVEKYPVIAAIWRWLIAADPAEVRAIPLVDTVENLPSWVVEPARNLVGFLLNSATTRPCRQLSAGARRMNARAGRQPSYGWTARHRLRVAWQVTRIRHWQVIDGDFSAAPDIEGAWFIDPPYAGSKGAYYVHGSSAIDYQALAAWCIARRGQAIVCEAAGAAWLPFVPLGQTLGIGGRASAEAIWLGGGGVMPQGVLAL